MASSRILPERQCRAIVAALFNRGVVWSPEHRCWHYAKSNGYCWMHQAQAEQDPEQPAEAPARDDTPETA